MKSDWEALHPEHGRRVVWIDDECQFFIKLGGKRLYYLVGDEWDVKKIATKSDSLRSSEVEK